MMCDARMVKVLCVAVDLLMGSGAWFIQPAAARPGSHYRRQQSRHGANLQSARRRMVPEEVRHRLHL